jgi:streptogramin lyase
MAVATRIIRRTRTRRLPLLERLESRELLAVGVTEYPIPLSGTVPNLPWILTTGGDGKFYYVEQFSSKVGVFDPTTHTSVEIPTSIPQVNPLAITTDLVGNVWFLEAGNPTNGTKVVEINTTTQAITEYAISASEFAFTNLAIDPNGNIWLTENGLSKVAEFTPSTLAFAEYTIPPVDGVNFIGYGITRGPAGQLWFTTEGSHYLGEIDSTTHVITVYPSVIANLSAITEGPDGNLWYTGSAAFGDQHNLGMINPTTHVVTTFLAGQAGDITGSIASGLGNNLAFSLPSAYPQVAPQIGVIDATTHAIRIGPIPGPSPSPGAMSTALDGNIWFLDLGNQAIGEIRIIPDTTTTLTAAPNPVNATQPVTFTATITHTPGTGSPTGLVTFLEGATTVGTAPVDGSGHANLSIFRLTIGSHTITAVYPGDANFGPSVSNPLTEVVQGIATTTQVSIQPSPGLFAQPVTLNADVHSATGIPVNSGFVAFSIDGFTNTYVDVVNGHAQVTLPFLTVGQHPISAQYRNDVHDFNSSQSSVVTETILPGASATTLQISPNPGATGHDITLTATVTGSIQPGNSGPNGIVYFLDGTIPIAYVFVASGQPASTTLTTFSAGVHSITAVFSGDGTYSASTSNVVAETVIAVPITVTTLYPSPNPSPAGSPLVLTATVTQTPGARTPTGIVMFSDQDGPLGVAFVNASGQAVFAIATLPPLRFYTITATYLGDSLYPPTTSNTVTEYISPPDGPRVTRITPSGSAKAPRTLVVFFDGLLHPATAQNVNNYRIVGWFGRHPRILVKSAVYNLATSSVTLTLRSPVPINGRYGLTIQGTGPSGVTDTDGRLLDGTFAGQPGSSFVTPLVYGNVFLSRPTPAGPKLAHHARR